MKRSLLRVGRYPSLFLFLYCTASRGTCARHSFCLLFLGCSSSLVSTTSFFFVFSLLPSGRFFRLLCLARRISLYTRAAGSRLNTQPLTRQSLSLSLRVQLYIACFSLTWCANFLSSASLIWIREIFRFRYAQFCAAQCSCILIR